jgi:hypothetical protein
MNLAYVPIATLRDSDLLTLWTILGNLRNSTVMETEEMEQNGAAGQYVK